jgi:hypothetical protein
MPATLQAIHFYLPLSFPEILRLKHSSVSLPVVLYGCETWSVTLREEHRLRVFENRVLREVFGAKSEEVRGEWRKLHKEELHELYRSSNIVGSANEGK